MSTVLSIAIILFESMCCEIYFNRILIAKRFAKRTFYSSCIILFSIAVPGFIISMFLENIWLKSLIIIFLYLVVMLIFYRGKILTCFCSAIILYATIIALDYFVILLLMSIFSVSVSLIIDNKLLFSFAVMISKLLLFIVIITFKEINERKKSIEYVRKKDWILLILQSIISIIAFISLIKLCALSNKIPTIVFFAAMGLLFSNLLVFYFLETTAQHESDVREKAIIKKQLDTEMASIISLKNSFDSQRSFMHDYKNHLNVVVHMLNTKNYEQALAYVKNLTGEIYYSLYRIKTNNDIIDVILNQKDQMAHQKGITLDIRSGDLSSLNIPAEELVVIISNVLDNAIEACEKVKARKVITVKLLIENSIFIFSVINPVNGHVEIIDNRIETTKVDHTTHGLGLQNISLALKRCNGDFEINCEEQEFQFTALIRLR